MFTGIVAGKAKVASLEEKDQLITLGIKLPASEISSFKVGASIAINGVCLTITHWQEAIVYFDVMQATLNLTNLGKLQLKDAVNYERAAKIGDEIGGHLMSGHISDQVELISRAEVGDNLELVFSFNPKWQDYLLDKGFVGLNGCSLTLAKVSQDEFSINLIPETRRATTFGELPVGSLVNLEIDPQTQAVVDTVKRVLAAQQASSKAR